MKKIICALLLPLALGVMASDDEGADNISTAILSTEVVPDASMEQGASSSDSFLSRNKIAIGTILKSHHFDKYDYHDYNETHDGVYLNVNRWSAGTFINSADERSVFVTYNPNLYQKESFVVNAVTGIADGYEGWENAQGDYLIILGVSAQWSVLKTLLTYEAISVGFELPLY